MAADPTLVKGAYLANTPGLNQWSGALKGIQDVSKSLVDMADARLKTQLEAIKAQGEQRIKGDDWTMKVADHYGKNVNGALGGELSVATDDVVWEKDIYLGASGNVAYQANVTNYNNQAAADTAGMAAILGTYDKSMNNEGEGAPLSNSRTGWDNGYLTDRNLAAQYTFNVGGKEITKTKGIDEDWFTENNEAILSGEIKITGKRYGLLKTPKNAPLTKVWVSPDEVARDIEKSSVDITSRGKIADLGALMVTNGQDYSTAHPGRISNQGKANEFIAHEDKRVDFNPDLVKQNINGIIHTDIKDWEMRSIVSDPMIGGDTSLLGVKDGDGFTEGHIDALFSQRQGEEFEAAIAKALGEMGNGNAEIDTPAEIQAVKEAMFYYGTGKDGDGQSTGLKDAIKNMVKDYLFVYAKNQFIYGSGGTWSPDLKIGETLAEDQDGEPLFEFID